MAVRCANYSPRIYVRELVATIGHHGPGVSVRFDSLFQDIRYAVRTLRRAPSFAATVAATIGLGLGLLGSAFTLLNA